MIGRRIAIAAGLALAMISLLAVPASGTARQRAIYFGRCPRIVPEEGEATKGDHSPRAAETTVPMAPSALQLCRYYGFGIEQTPETRARAGRLQSERVLRKAASVRSIAREFDSLTPLPEGPIGCPADEGARLYAIFAYQGEVEAVPVEVHLSGCRSAWNGRTPRAYWTTPALSRRLEALTSARLS